MSAPPGFTDPVSSVEVFVVSSMSSPRRRARWRSPSPVLAGMFEIKAVRCAFELQSRSCPTVSSGRGRSAPELELVDGVEPSSRTRAELAGLFELGELVPVTGSGDGVGRARRAPRGVHLGYAELAGTSAVSSVSTVACPESIVEALGGTARALRVGERRLVLGDLRLVGLHRRLSLRHRRGRGPAREPTPCSSRRNRGWR